MPLRISADDRRSGREWAAQEFQRVNALPMPTKDDHGDLCAHCEEMTKRVDGDFAPFHHQAGYRALKISASRCPICYAILHAFIRRNESVIRSTNKRSRVWGRETEIHEVIQLEGKNRKRDGFEFICRWIGGCNYVSFILSGDTAVVYTLRPEVKRLKPVMGASYDLEARLETIGDWLQNCVSSHTCSNFDYHAQTPTRLLDLQPDIDSTSVRLVQLDSASEQYAVLSHCWGSGRPLKTLKASTTANMQGIEFQELPRLFQEAIFVLRRLNIRYLWIDTLCIIQDDEQDWEQESARMCQVFRNAFICIAALAAEDCTQPLFHDFKASFVDQRLGLACRFLEWHCKRETNPLQQRAWTLQEILLSRRVLFFSKREVTWRCSEAYLYEDDICHNFWRGTSRGHVTNKIEFDGLGADNVEAIYRCWSDIAAEFSARMITYNKDRLPALAGITTHFQSRLHDEPLLGLWRNRFAEGLTWRPPLRRSGTINPIVPTWSWLSIEGSQPYPTRLLELSLRLCDAIISWSGTPLSSPIASCTVTVEGELSPVILCPSQSRSIRQDRSLSLSIENEASIGLVTFDRATEFIPPNLFCVCLGTVEEPSFSPYPDVRRHIVLLLQPSQTTENTFVRVGVGKLSPSPALLGQQNTFAEIMPESHHFEVFCESPESGADEFLVEAASSIIFCSNNRV